MRFTTYMSGPYFVWFYWYKLQTLELLAIFVNMLKGIYIYLSAQYKACYVLKFVPFIKKNVAIGCSVSISFLAKSYPQLRISLTTF